mmetsp:Transcript_124189/g.397488  ORF Transcript_124189/g.397488 Transcript_124189/m.397488 type:complete len:200 (-) Transcript_124189:96-695(-)
MSEASCSNGSVAAPVELTLMANGKVMTLSAEAFSIGRLACCDVHIQKQTEDSSVSRIQCWVFSLPIGLIVVDGWSVAGTSLLDDDDRTNTLPASSPNGRRNFIIPHGKPATLRLATFGTEVTLNPKLCVICMERPRAIRLSCGHQVLCVECVHYIAGPHPSQHMCPICREPVGHMRLNPRAVDQKSYALAPIGRAVGGS